MSVSDRCVVRVDFSCDKIDGHDNDRGGLDCGSIDSTKESKASRQRSQSPTTKKTVELLIKFEGFRSKKYLCDAGKPTIGYGTVIKDRNSRLHTANITKEEALELLAADLAHARSVIKSCVTQPITVNQGAALTSFVYNCGEAAFKKSTLLKEINKGNFDSVPAEFRRWNKIGVKESQGLTNRRNKEIDLFKSKDSKEDSKARALAAEAKGNHSLADKIFRDADLGEWLLKQADNSSLSVKTRAERYIMACACGNPSGEVLGALMSCASFDELLEFRQLALSDRFSSQNGRNGFNNEKVASHFWEELEKRGDSSSDDDCIIS